MDRGGLLFRSSRPFGFWRRLADALVGRYLARRAQEHLAQGMPPLAGFSFDYIARDISLHGRFERDELAILGDFLAPLADSFATATALDIGANIGNHSLFFAPRFKHVQSFEPNPRTYGVLSVNAQLASNVTTHNLALGEKAGVLTLSFDPLNVGEASLVSSGGGKTAVAVEVRRLDDLVAAFGSIAFIKIDVEGFELQVLRGAARVIAEQRPVIAFEQNCDAFKDGRSETVEYLKQLGYRFCLMTKRNVGHGVTGQLSSIVRKLARGLEYDVLLVEDIPSGHYPMIVAIDEKDLALLARPVS